MAQENIGKWSAEIDNSSKTPFLSVNGTFPTNGEKPRFDLIKHEPQGINPTELILTLVFGSLADPTGKGSASVNYSESLLTTNTYKTVLVIDGNDREIASINL